MSAERKRPRTLVEQEMYDARQRKIASALKEIVVESYGRHVVGILDTQWLDVSEARADWLASTIDRALDAAVAGERQRCFAILNKTIRDIYAGGEPDGNTAQGT